MGQGLFLVSSLSSLTCKSSEDHFKCFPHAVWLGECQCSSRSLHVLTVSVNVLFSTGLDWTFFCTTKSHGFFDVMIWMWIAPSPREAKLEPRRYRELWWSKVLFDPEGHVLKCCTFGHGALYRVMVTGMLQAHKGWHQFSEQSRFCHGNL